MQGLTTQKETPNILNITEELANLKKEVIKNTVKKKEQEPISWKEFGEMLNMIEIYMQWKEKIEIHTEKHTKIPTYTASWSIKNSWKSYKSLEIVYMWTIQYSYIIEEETITIKKNDGESRSEIVTIINTTDETKHNIGEAYAILQDIEKYFTPYTIQPTHDTNE